MRNPDVDDDADEKAENSKRSNNLSRPNGYKEVLHGIFDISFYVHAEAHDRCSRTTQRR